MNKNPMQPLMMMMPGVPAEQTTADAVAVAFRFVQLCAQRELPGPTGEIRELAGDDRIAKGEALLLLASHFAERTDFLEKTMQHRQHCENSE